MAGRHAVDGASEGSKKKTPGSKTTRPGSFSLPPKSKTGGRATHGPKFTRHVSKTWKAGYHTGRQNPHACKRCWSEQALNEDGLCINCYRTRQ